MIKLYTVTRNNALHSYNKQTHNISHEKCHTDWNSWNMFLKQAAVHTSIDFK